MVGPHAECSLSLAFRLGFAIADTRRMPSRLRTSSAALLLALAAGCGGGGTSKDAAPTDPAFSSPTPSMQPTAPVASPRPTQTRAAPARPTKVLVIVEENHTQAAALAGMPNLAKLARRYGYAAGYKAITYPSLPNYLAIAGGSTFGVTHNAGPAVHRLTGPSAFDTAIAAGKTAKVYAEAMPRNCGPASTTRYAVKHNPWPYFSDPTSRANCERFNVESGTATSGPLRSDIDAGRLPNVGMLVPDICNDAHDCSLALADRWLKRWLDRLMDGPDYRAGRLAIIVTFDEDDRSAGNSVLTVVISPYTSRVKSTLAYSHYSITRYFAEITGTTPLRAAATTRSLRAEFGI